MSSSHQLELLSLHNNINEQLIQACIELNLPDIERLLKQGADANFLTKRYSEDDFLFEQIFCPEFADFFSKHALSCDLNPYFQSPLDIIVAQDSDFEQVTTAAKLLLDYGANVQGTKSGGYFVSPLHEAVDAENFSLTQLLLERGANIKDTDCFLETPLYTASWAQASGELVELLIQYGAELNVKNVFGKTAAINLLSDSDNNSHPVLSFLEVLAKNGADFTIVDQQQQSVWLLIQNQPALKIAVIKGLIESDKGCDINFGITEISELADPAKQLIALNVLDNIIEADLMRMYPENLLEYKLIQATYDLDLNKMTSLLEQGANPNFLAPEKDPIIFEQATNVSALHILAEGESFGKFKNISAEMTLLLDYGANPNLLDSNGDTPLHLHAQSSFYWHGLNFSDSAQVNVLNILLTHGADITIENYAGHTPVYYLEYKPSLLSALNLHLEQMPHTDIAPVMDEVILPIAPIIQEELILLVNDDSANVLTLSDIIEIDQVERSVFNDSTNFDYFNTTSSDTSPTPMITSETTFFSTVVSFLPLSVSSWMGWEL